MFRVTWRGDRRLDIEMSGKLDLLPSTSAIMIELSRIPELFRMIRRFSRAALLSDIGWVRKAGELEGALMPGLEIKAFSRDQREEAERWLAAEVKG